MRSVQLVAFSLFAGCVAGQAPFEEDTSSIIGGTVDTGDPSVVLVFAQVPGAASGSLCTGEVISPHVVLTAAHCVSPIEVGAGAQFSVFTGNNFNVKPAPGTTLAVKETHPNAMWSSANLPGGHDVGVVILAAPTTLKPLPYLKSNALTMAMLGQPIRLVGYGLDNAAAQSGAGVKRQTTTTTASSLDSVLINLTDKVHDTCNGDSGGPAFLTLGGVETIVGTTSYGDVTCAQGGFDTRVDAETTFIDGYVNMFDPGFAPPAPAGGGGTGPGMGGGPGGGSGTGTSGGGDSSSGPPSSGGSPTTGQGGPSSQAAIGKACKHDADCASHACGIGSAGTLVCVAGGNQAAGSAPGGCSAASGARDANNVGLALLLLLGFGGLVLRRRVRAKAARA